MTGQHATKKHQDHHKQMPHNDPLRNSNNYLEKVREKPDEKNSIATNHLATKCTHWRVVYNGKLRKIDACMKGILQIINILLLYEPYVCVTPCHKVSAFQAKIKSPANIALGAVALQTVLISQ